MIWVEPIFSLARSKKVGAIIAGLLGMAWSIVTFLAVPVMVVERKSPVEHAGKRAGAGSRDLEIYICHAWKNWKTGPQVPF